jgi:hypothetical protein
MSIDFTKIKFNPDFHTYYLNGRVMKNVTKFISQFKPPFPREKIAMRKAEEYGVPVAQILAEWDEAGRVSRERGTKVHQYIQQVLTGQADPTDKYLALNDRLPEMEAFDRLWRGLRGVTSVYQVEWVIGDEAFNLAGTIDAMFFGDNMLMNMWDWKTGKNFTIDNQFERLLPPFDHLPNCDLMYYSLQLSAYRLIIERNTNLVLGDSYIGYFGPDGGGHIYKAMDLRDRLAGILISNSNL